MTAASSNRVDFDVVVVGDGTAGLAAAIAVRKQRPFRVAIVGRSLAAPVQAPELLPANEMQVFQRLGIWRRFLAEHHAQIIDRFGTGPGQTYIYVPDQTGWTINRPWFDDMLISEAKLRGVAFRPDAALIAATTTGDPVLTLRLPDQRTVDISCRFVIDASGAQAVYARHRGAHLRITDHLAGVTVRFNTTQPSGAIRVEPWSDGWWYSDQRPDGRLLVTCMTDPNAVSCLGLAALDVWWAALDRTHITRARVRDAWAESTPVVHSASSHRLEPMIGPNWLAVDEAACASHPLAGQGILRAVKHGELAGNAAVDHLVGHPRLARYAHRVASEYNRYVRALAGYYAQEQFRWANRDFWRQRRTLV